MLVGKTYSVLLQHRSQLDLLEIEDYVSQQSPTDAVRLVDHIVEAIGGLATMPGRFRLAGLKKHPRVRRMVVKSHIILYLIEPRKSQVLVLRVVHSHRRIRSSFLDPFESE